MKYRDKSSEKKIIVFETLNFFNFALALIYCRMGFSVMYFETSDTLKHSKWFVANKERFRISDIWNEEVCFFDTRLSANEYTLDNINKVYDLYFSNRKFIKIIICLFKSDVIHLAYRKIVSNRLLSFYRHQIILNELLKQASPLMVHYVPSQNIYFFKLASFYNQLYILNKKIKIPGYSFVTNFFSVLSGKIAQYFILTLWPFSLIKGISGGIKPSKMSPKEYDIALRVYKTGFNFGSKTRTIDFLLDGKSITKDNTLFCIETDISKEFREELNKRGYYCADIPNILREGVSVDFIKSVYFKTLLPAWLRLCIALLPESFSMICSVRTMLALHLRWSLFLHKYSVKNYVVYNDYTFPHIARNILLSQQGVKTWYYAHSSHTPDLFNPPQAADKNVRSVTFSYLYYDNFISWSRRLSDFYTKTHNRIGNFINIGCLWSEHIKSISETSDYTGVMSEIYKKHRQNGKTANKIIGVFDTSFGGNESPLTFYDMRCFLEGILKLHEEKKDFVFIVKLKNFLKYVKEQVPDIVPYYKKMQTMDRFYLLEDVHDPASINAISDLAISACFTSTTNEMIGVGKKAVYFDGADRFRGYYYDRFPNLIAHGYDELAKLVDHWIYELKDEEFHKYIETHVKDTLDPYVDGRAITRFRELLLK